MPGHWEGSTRSATLPADWPQRREPILERDDHRCTWLDGLPDGGPQWYLAGRYAAQQRCAVTQELEVDHIGDPGDHRSENLRTLCAEHHGRRSSQQGNAARWRYRNARPVERHPGLR